jgi:tRNA-2-methylthio-N6-dimethylallyladenosine synthase
MKKTYHIITIGCQMNVSDSERIASCLEFYGFKPEADRRRAGVVILNTCGIRESAENRNYGLIPAIKKENKKVKIILAGCLSERKDVVRRLKDKVDIWLPIGKLPELYKELGLKEKKFSKKDYLDIKPKTVSPFSVFIPIGNGCNNFCTYCVVPYARGREQYRPAHKIIKEAKEFVASGYKEIFLIAQNVNSYKSSAAKEDLKYFSNKKIGQAINFPELLKAVANLSPFHKGDLPDFWVRFVTSHPKDLSDELIKVAASGGRMTPYLHLPVQAGDDKVLVAMNRKYTAKHYLSLVAKIRKAMPDVGLSSDIIVGFPGETKKQFANTLRLMEKAKYDMIYGAKFSPRPGTAAYRMKDNVSAAEKERRYKKLDEILRRTALANNKKFLGKKIFVLVEEKNKKGEWIGKNGQMKTVVFTAPVRNDLAGKFVSVRINKVRDFGLTGVLVK